MLTSLLFAAAHGTPAHALATLPVGICLHWVYLASRNLWAPVLLHALSNGVAVTLMKLQADPALPDNPALLFASCGYLAVVGTLFWQARRTPDQEQRPASSAFPMLAACSILAFTCVFVWARFAAAS
jgi:membrane protease YdiL (CAAX protease family)